MLSKFNEQVLKFGAEACLPANLTDEWLNWLGNELEFLSNDAEIDPNIKQPSCALAAIFEILIHKTGGSEVKIKYDELIGIMKEYLIEIELEKVSRWSDITCDSATLDNIFSGRDIEFRRDRDEVHHLEG